MGYQYIQIMSEWIVNLNREMEKQYKKGNEMEILHLKDIKSDI